MENEILSVRIKIRDLSQYKVSLCFNVFLGLITITITPSIPFVRSEIGEIVGPGPQIVKPGVTRAVALLLGWTGGGGGGVVSPSRFVGREG